MPLLLHRTELFLATLEDLPRGVSEVLGEFVSLLTKREKGGISKIIGIVGRSMKELRLERRLTLKGVAERNGRSAGFLPQLERNRPAPSISMLCSLAQALGVPITHYFAEAINPTKVVRAEDRETFRFEGSAITYSFPIYSMATASVAGRTRGGKRSSLSR